MRTLTSADLYEIVATYSDFGNHHTGTPADAATTAWLTELLAGVGAEVAAEEFEFDRYVCAAELRVGAGTVPSVPVFYSALGEWTTSDLGVVHVDAGASGSPHGLDPHLVRAPEAAALVVAVEGPDDLPVQCNRVPVLPASPGRPAVIIPGNWADRVASGDAVLDFAATVEPGTSANLVAALGPIDGPAVNITTPLTGWTPAGGERGTGLAAAVAMAVDLARDHRVALSVCSGHEIDHLGLRHHLAGRDVAGAPAIHLGSSVASVEPASSGPAGLGDQRMVLTTARGDVRDQLGRRARDANWTMQDLDPWPGEGGTWREAGASVLSFLGTGSLFHTVADTAESATTPEAVALATEVAIDAARLFLASAHGP